MKIAILSDLHREFWTLEIPSYSHCDIVVFAGDISCPVEKTMDFLITYSNKRKKTVISVLGNHDFYRSNYEEALNYATKRAKESEYLYLLENDCCSINGIKFIGCTLWSDFSYGTNGNVSVQENNAYIAQADISDFYEIRFGKDNKRLSAMKCMDIYNKSVKYLKDELKNTTEEKTVIITHFGVDKKCSNAKHYNSNLQPYFISNISDIINNHKIDYWIYGHTHYSNTFRIGDIKVIGNQAGYPTESEKDVKTNMDYSFDI